MSTGRKLGDFWCFFWTKVLIILLPGWHIKGAKSNIPADRAVQGVKYGFVCWSLLSHCAKNALHIRRVFSVIKGIHGVHIFYTVTSASWRSWHKYAALHFACSGAGTRQVHSAWERQLSGLSLMSYRLLNIKDSLFSCIIKGICLFLFKQIWQKCKTAAILD